MSEETLGQKHMGLMPYPEAVRFLLREKTLQVASLGEERWAIHALLELMDIGDLPHEEVQLMVEACDHVHAAAERKRSSLDQRHWAYHHLAGVAADAKRMAGRLTQRLGKLERLGAGPAPALQM